jgi:serine/threonine protein kinase
MSQEADRQKQIESIYVAATQLDSDERTAFLEKTCCGDASLLSEVASLLAVNDSNWLLDQSVDHYKILSPIGRGGMGQVFLAEDVRLGRKVAIKFLPAPFMRNEDRVRRFVQEARAASALNHPNIVTIHEFGESQAGSFIVMEFIQGRTLRAVIEKSLPPQEVIRLGVQIARALSVAHAVGIVHRDIKPDNIVLRDDGYVKVLDFGLARLTAGSGFETTGTTFGATSSSTAVGMLIGTLNYMSPEQVRAQEVTSATDVFSLGIILYEMATGKHPFRTATKAGTMTEIVTVLPPRPSELNPAIPASLDTVIMRSLEKDAKYRISASELSAALSRINEFVAGVDASALHAAANRRSVGRDREHNELRMAFETAAGGRGLVVCVTGEPGSGKTTLVKTSCPNSRLQARHARWRGAAAQSDCRQMRIFRFWKFWKV